MTVQRLLCIVRGSGVNSQQTMTELCTRASWCANNDHCISCDIDPVLQNCTCLQHAVFI